MMRQGVAWGRLFLLVALAGALTCGATTPVFTCCDAAGAAILGLGYDCYPPLNDSNECAALDTLFQNDLCPLSATCSPPSTLDDGVTGSWWNNIDGWYNAVIDVGAKAYDICFAFPGISCDPGTGQVTEMCVCAGGRSVSA